jgi:antitoxin CptB
MEKEILIKQLLYRSNHRGCKETDILLGRFFNKKFSEFDEEKLKLYDQFIEEDDMLIYDWILGKISEEPKYLNIILEIRKFHDIH